MSAVAVVVLLCLLAAVAVIVFLRHRAGRHAGSVLATSEPAGLDWRSVGSAGDEGSPAVELWWELRSVMSIERLDARDLPASVPVPGALGELVARLLDDKSVRQFLAGERFAVVKLPAGSRARDLVQTVDGRTVPIVRDASGRFGTLGTVVGGTGAGAGVGAAVTTAPAVAAAMGAVWTHQQLASTMTAMREGLERIAIRLDDNDHGVLAAAHAHAASLSGPPSSWSEFDRDALAQHRVKVDGVYHTAIRRADRRFEKLAAGKEIPRLDPGEVAEIQRDLVLRVDAELVVGQMNLVQTLMMIESDPTAALAELADVEGELATALDKLALQMGDALERGLPARHRVGSRRNARQLQADVASALGGLRGLLSDLNGDNDAELLVGIRDGEFEVRSLEPAALGPATAPPSTADDGRPSEQDEG